MRVGRIVAAAAVAVLATLGVLAYRQAAPGPTGPPPETGPGWTDLSPREMRRLLNEGGVVLVNVHVPYEGEIPGTDLFMPYYAIRARARELPGRDATIAVYCRSGRMSREAAQALAELGYRRVYNLRGGFEAWRQAGLPFVEKGEEAGRR